MPCPARYSLRSAAPTRLNLFLTLFLSFFLQASSHADQRLQTLVKDVEDAVIGWRRDIHQHPELAFQETRTAALVAAHLRQLGLDEVRTGIAGTGVVGLLHGAEPGPLVALRADMDALPIREQTGLPFASRATATWQGREVPVMHACGHDAHVAMLMGAASVLAELRAELYGSVMFIFQPAEEGSEQGGGAEAMLAAGMFERQRPAAIFGLHVMPFELGSLHYRSGPTAAAADGFHIEFRGEGTHAAMPWGGGDSLSAAAQTALSLQSIVSRRVDITRVPAILSVGSLQAGNRANVIPSEAQLAGTIRTYDPAMRQQIHGLVKTLADSAAASYGVEASTRIELGYPVLVNDPELAKRMHASLERVAPGRVHTAPLATAAEDFAYFAREVPGLFLALGAMPPGVRVFNHSPNFTIDERALGTGVEVLSRLALDYLADGD